MIAGIGRRASALLVAPLLFGIMARAPGERTAVRTTSAPTTAAKTPAYSPPAREVSPFSSPDAFCTPSENRFDTVPPSDPSLKDNPVTVVMLTPGPSSPSTSDSPVSGPGDAASVAETFATLINRCGGIGGRRLDLHVVVESGDPVGDCLTATQQLHAVVVVSWTASPAQRCVARDQRTIMVTESNVANTDLTATSGRLVATGSGEGVERARLLDLVASGRLDGRSVAVVAGTSPSDREFAQTARSVLTEHRIPIVEPRHADTVLEPTLEPSTIRPLILETAAARHHAPLDLYGFSTASAAVLDHVPELGRGAPAQILHNVHLYSYEPIDDDQFRASRSPSTFSQMCNQEFATALAKGLPPPSSSSTTTTLPATPG